MKEATSKISNLKKAQKIRDEMRKLEARIRDHTEPKNKSIQTQK